MGNILPVKYRKTAEGPIASYDYSDIAAGTGYVTYNAAKIYDESVVDYILTKEDPFTVLKIGTGAACDNAAYVTTADITFSGAIFKKTQVVEGTLHCQIPLCVVGEDADEGATTLTEVTVMKDGVFVASGAATVIFLAADMGSNGLTKMQIFDVDVPRTIYKKGSLLSINVDIDCKRTEGADPLYAATTFDPKNRDFLVTDAAGVGRHIHLYPSTDSSASSIMKFDVPFDIDL